MNREIKFRGWDERKEVMHFDFQFVRSGTDGNDWILFNSDKEHNITTNPQNPYFSQQLKIMQYTGLKDKMGKEIYEGDIVKTDSGGIMKVCWREDMAMFVLRFNKGASTDMIKDCEIIGNIYEKHGSLS